ncbi:thermonuclease family protein [Candidatus Bipolaricaulota bacterium]|nr:thermonuclease family protein [Candidatus Bipolaricaulota bacterium]
MKIFRIFRMRHASVLELLLLVTLICAVGVIVTANEQPDHTRAVITGRVIRVFDGDTIQIDTGIDGYEIIAGIRVHRYERVRYLGIDTPEMGRPREFYAFLARGLNRRLVLREQVKLELVAGNERDGYGRLLAYVYVEQDGEWIMVNAELIRRGAAEIYFLSGNERYAEHFHAMKIEAIAARVGLWGRYPGELSISDLEADPVKHILEAVTMRFMITQMREDRKGFYIYAASQPRFNFRVFIPQVRLSAFIDSKVGPDHWQVGDEVVVSGILDWEGGLRLTLESPLQVKQGGG